MAQILELKMLMIEALNSILQGIVHLAPRAIGAIGLLLLGLVCAKVIEWILRGILRRTRFDVLLEKLHVRPVLERISGARPTALAARGAYWLVVILFLQAAVEVLGFVGASDVIRRAAGYIPNVLAALLLVLLGVFASNLLAGAVSRAAEPLGAGYARTLSRLTSTVVLVVVGTMAVSQLRLDTEVLRAILLTLLVGGALGLALTFGLGSREITRGILAGFYARRLFHSGDQVHISGEKGTLVSITPTQTVIETHGALKAIPNDVYLRSVVEKRVP